MEPAFHLFLRLPPELQVMIWKAVMEQEPRVVMMIGTEGSVPRSYRRFNDNSCTSIVTSMPTILQVSQGSRIEGLKRYSPYLKKQKYSYINYEINTLYIPCPELNLYSKDSPEFLKLRYLAVDYSPFNIHSAASRCTELIPALKNGESKIETIMFIARRMPGRISIKEGMNSEVDELRAIWIEAGVPANRIPELKGLMSETADAEMDLEPIVEELKRKWAFRARMLLEKAIAAFEAKHGSPSAVL